MSLFTQAIRRWLRGENEQLPKPTAPVPAWPHHEIEREEDEVHFTVRKAEGGWIVDFYTWDTKRHGFARQSKVVTSGEDLSKTIVAIMTVKAMEKKP